MRERLSGLLGDEIAGRVTIKTFHAFGAMLLREHAERLGLSPEFVILAEEDRAALLRQACPELKQAERLMPRWRRFRRRRTSWRPERQATVWQ